MGHRVQRAFDRSSSSAVLGQSNGRHRRSADL